MASKENLINDLAGMIRMMETTFAFFTPSTAKLLTPSEVPSMKEIVLGGEPVSQKLIQTWYDHLRLSIVCGPTEAMIAVLAREVKNSKITGANLG
jgi:non-ribosomal peptide synthetase component F